MKQYGEGGGISQYNGGGSGCKGGGTNGITSSENLWAKVTSA